MKKLLVLAAFLGLGYVGVNAQTVAPSKSAPKATATTQKEIKNDRAEESQATHMEASDRIVTKKECSPAEKKSCSSASGKKACCSSKNKSAESAPAAKPAQ